MHWFSLRCPCRTISGQAPCQPGLDPPPFPPFTTRHAGTPPAATCRASTTSSRPSCASLLGNTLRARWRAGATRACQTPRCLTSRPTATGAQLRSPSRSWEPSAGQPAGLANRSGRWRVVCWAAQLRAFKAPPHPPPLLAPQLPDPPEALQLLPTAKQTPLPSRPRCLCKLLDGIQDHYTYAQPGIQRCVFHTQELVRWVWWGEGTTDEGRLGRGGWRLGGACRLTSMGQPGRAVHAAFAAWCDSAWRQAPAHLLLLPLSPSPLPPGVWRSRSLRTLRPRACSSSSLPSAGSTACCCGRCPSRWPSDYGTPT
jgi:hypothetical protein